MMRGCFAATWGLPDSAGVHYCVYSTMHDADISRLYYFVPCAESAMLCNFCLARHYPDRIAVAAFPAGSYTLLVAARTRLREAEGYGAQRSAHPLAA